MSESKLLYAIEGDGFYHYDKTRHPAYRHLPIDPGDHSLVGAEFLDPKTQTWKPAKKKRGKRSS